MIFNKALDEIKVEDILLLVENKITEGGRLDFKRDHYGRSDKDKREFAADVTAMANASGGHLIIGVGEDQGRASSAEGVETSDPDKLVLMAAESLRSMIEPEIFGLKTRWLRLADSRGFLIIHVPRSWSAPHAVTFEKSCKFHLRDENGNHQMSVQEIRRAFTFAGEIENRLRDFRNSRIEMLKRNEGPLATSVDEPKLIFHLLPLTALTDPRQIQFGPHESGIGPFSARGFNSLHSIDGFVTYSGPEEITQAARAFTTLFRSGIVEAVGGILAGNSGTTPTLNLTGIEKSLIDMTACCLRELNNREITYPFYAMVSILNAKGHAAPASSDRDAISYPYRGKDLILPELLIDEKNIKSAAPAILRPLFNLLWNAFGWPQSTNYDRDGIWNGR
jgi:hypothetical protein